MNYTVGAPVKGSPHVVFPFISQNVFGAHQKERNHVRAVFRVPGPTSITNPDH